MSVLTERQIKALNAFARTHPHLASAFGYTVSDDNEGLGDALNDGAGGSSDHGALSGLTDDDHPQYALADGSRNSAFRGAVVRLSTPQTLTTGASASVTWDTEVIDTDEFWSVSSPDQFIIPSGITLVRLSAFVEFESNATGRRQGLITKDALFTAGSLPNHIQNAVSGAPTAFTIISAPSIVSGGEVFRLRVFQSSGGDLDFDDGSRTWFALEVLG